MALAYTSWFEKDDASPENLTIPTQSVVPKVSITEIAAPFAISILGGMLSYIEPEVSIIKITFLAPVVAEIYLYIINLFINYFKPLLLI